MEQGNVKELSAFRFEKAGGNLEAAAAMMKDGFLSFALNRAYYAAFDAMRAVNALDGFDSSKHSGVIAHFNQEYVKTGVFPPETSAVIRKASMLREKSDYEDFFEADIEETADIIGKVKQFLEQTARYLKSRNVL